MYHTVHIFGLDFICASSLADILDFMMDYQNHPDYQNKLPFVITPNADQVVQLDQPQHQALKEKLSQALFILPDGYPIIWFSRLIRKPLKARLTGSDLFPLLWDRVKQSQSKVFMIVSREFTGRKLKQEYNNMSYYALPFFDLNTITFDAICQEIIERITDFQPKYVIIGVGFPKQEWLGLTAHTALKAQNISPPLFLCIGASAEFYVGTQKRAPQWLQNMGLEWSYRLWQEPRRMWRRYLIGSWFLLKLYVKELSKRTKD
jgi:N-acetylglucosaminyldiphosphoundecaprenol N-acetyl-beta-D-mannosaminyltransferase